MDDLDAILDAEYDRQAGTATADPLDAALDAEYDQQTTGGVMAGLSAWGTNLTRFAGMQPPPDRTAVGEYGAGIVRGGMGMIGSAGGVLGAGASALETMTGDTMLTNAAQGYGGAVASVAGVGRASVGSDPAHPIAGMLGEGTAQLAAQFGIAAGTGGGSLPAQLAIFAGTAAAPVVGQTYNDAMAAHGDQNRALAEAGVNGAITAATSAIPGIAILKKVPGGNQLLRAAAAKVIARLGMAGIAEGSQEWTEQFANQISEEWLRNGRDLNADLVGEVWNDPAKTGERRMAAIGGAVLGTAARGVPEVGGMLAGRRTAQDAATAVEGQGAMRTAAEAYDPANAQESTQKPPATPPPERPVHWSMDKMEDVERAASEGRLKYPDVAEPQDVAAFAAKMGIVAKKGEPKHLEAATRSLFRSMDNSQRFVLVDVPIDRFSNTRTGGDIYAVSEIGSPTERQAGYAGRTKETSPPIVVVSNKQGGLDPWILDGNNRVVAARLRGDTTVRAYVQQNVAKKFRLQKSTPAPEPRSGMAAALGDMPASKWQVRAGEFDQPRPVRKPGPTVTAAAVRTKDGRIFEGTTHADAVTKAAEAGAISSEWATNELDSLDLFKTSDGSIITREEASQRYGRGLSSVSNVAGAAEKHGIGTTRETDAANMAPVVAPPESAASAETNKSPGGLNSTTATKNASMEIDREALGLGRINSPERQHDADMLRQAREQKLHEPDNANRLVAEIIAKPRTLTPTEDAGLRLRAAELKHQYKPLEERMAVTKDDAEIADLSAKMARIQDDFDQLSVATKLGGSEWGRAGHARQIALDSDFNIVAVKARAKAAKGASLTKAESAKFDALAKDLQAKDARIAELEKQAQEHAATEVLRRHKAERPTREPTRKAKDRTVERAELVAKVRDLVARGCQQT